MVFMPVAEATTLDPVRFSMAAYVASDGPYLIGRDSGRVARAALEQEISSQRAGTEPVAIDFKDVRGMSVPFADAFFVPLLSPRLVAGYYDEHPIVVMNAEPDVAETLAAVMRDRNLAVVSLHPAPHAELLGGEPSLRETLQLSAQLGTFSAGDLARELGLSAQAANNRLKQLVQLGALVRIAHLRPAGGREFHYRLPRPTSQS